MSRIYWIKDERDKDDSYVGFEDTLEEAIESALELRLWDIRMTGRYDEIAGEHFTHYYIVVEEDCEKVETHFINPKGEITHSWYYDDCDYEE